MKNRNVLRGKLATFTSGSNSNASTTDHVHSQGVPPFISNRQRNPSMSANFMEIGKGLLLAEHAPRNKRSLDLSVNTNEKGSYDFRKNNMFDNVSPTTVNARTSKP